MKDLRQRERLKRVYAAATYASHRHYWNTCTKQNGDLMEVKTAQIQFETETSEDLSSGFH